MLFMLRIDIFRMKVIRPGVFNVCLLVLPTLLSHQSGANVDRGGRDIERATFGILDSCISSIAFVEDSLDIVR
jgi:hypothetical protein